MTDRPFPQRPPLSAPEPVHRHPFARQPRLGLAGLLFVVPVALFLAFAAGGAEESVLVFGPLVAFALPAVAMVAFWWEDWPGNLLPRGWSGLTDTLLIVVLAIALALAGQAVVGRVDATTLFDPTPPAGHPPTFPATMPVAAAAFVAMLQLTLVNEGWPLRRLGRYRSGLAALALSWAIALAVYLLVDVHPVAGSGLRVRQGVIGGGDLGALLILIGVWQVWWCLLWRGWPIALIRRRSVRLPAANGVVLGGAALTYIALRQAGVTPSSISAAGGSFIGAGLIMGIQFEGVWRNRLSAAGERAANLAASVLLAVVLDIGLTRIAEGLRWTKLEPADWVAHVGLNAIGIAVILHVAIGHRWPFHEASAGERADRPSSRRPDANLRRDEAGPRIRDPASAMVPVISRPALLRCRRTM